jgi:hypothetical protein
VTPPVNPPVTPGGVNPITEIIVSPVIEAKEITTESVKEIKKIIETPEGSAATKAVSTVVLVTTVAVTAAPIIFLPSSLFEIFLIPLRLASLLLLGFGIKRKNLPWGVVYDSVTKLPIDPAYLNLKDSSGKSIASAITDIDGRYGFFAEPGVYVMTANKTNYLFPSKKLLGKTEDEIYTDLYFGENLEIKNKGEVIGKNIPLDPIKFDWNEFAKKDKRLMKFYSKWDFALRRVSDWLFAPGFFVAIIAFFAAPYPYNTIILGLYVFLLIIRILGVKPKAFGRVVEKNSQNPLSFAIIRIVIPESNFEIGHRVTDKYGRYYCLVAKGKYCVKIEKKNEDGSYSLIYTSEVIDVTKTGIIKNKFEI